MELLRRIVLRLPGGELRVRDRLQTLNELCLIESDFLCLRILAMASSAVCELVPIDLELPEDPLQLLEDMFNPPLFSSDLEIVDVHRDHPEKFAFLVGDPVLVQQLPVDSTAGHAHGSFSDTASTTVGEQALEL